MPLRAGPRLQSHWDVHKFSCDACHGPLFFENTLCGRCGRAVAYFPDPGEMGVIEGKPCRPCRNYEVENVCNWVVPAGEGSDFCRSCRLTRVIPDLADPNNRERWRRIELAKRRLLCTLFELGLPVIGRDENEAAGLAFEFRADAPGAEGAVMTGHDEGVITLNVVEADDDERERRRLQLHEPYRTLLGHFRHEIGHYYWDVLLRNSTRLDDWRRMFGDETTDYSESLQRHYEQGPPSDWQQRFVSTYASSHPWEDWAETWAHYLHMIDTLDTAAASGIALELQGSPAQAEFGLLVKDWLELTCVLNNLNRSMGLQDAYPFVLSTAALEKLRFVHELVAGAR
jgi:hypothetical protein